MRFEGGGTMKRLTFATGIFILLAFQWGGWASAENLGKLSANPVDPESTSNSFGAGSPFRQNSINNRFGPYPLGLNRFHDGLENLLIKGVIEAANRLRYVTYCCWVIGDVEISESCSEYSEFVDAFTRRENALALGLYMMDTNYGVSGSNAMSKIFNEGKKEYDCAFRLMQSNDLGAYGLYYAGTIYNWGLAEKDEKGFIRLTEAGKTIYGIVDRYYQQTQPAYYKRYKGNKIVPKKALLQWAQVNDFDNIRHSRHKQEREFHEDILFRLDKKKVGDYRRDTFAFVMECIKKCSNSNTAFDEDVLRNIHYYSSYVRGNGKIHKFEVPDHYDDVRFYWSVYEGHVYFRWWLSKYFQVFLNHLKSCDNVPQLMTFLMRSTEIDSTILLKLFVGNGRTFSMLPWNPSLPCSQALIISKIPFQRNPSLTMKITRAYLKCLRSSLL